MRYRERKGYVKHGNSSWRRTIYTDAIGPGSIRDFLMDMRLKECVRKRILFNLWMKDKVPVELVFPPTQQEIRMRKWRV